MFLVLMTLLFIHMAVFVKNSKIDTVLAQGFWTVLILVSILLCIIYAFKSA